MNLPDLDVVLYSYIFSIEITEICLKINIWKICIRFHIYGNYVQDSAKCLRTIWKSKIFTKEVSKRYSANISVREGKVIPY